MFVNAAQKSVIQRVLNVFETGSADGKYDALVVFNDGPNEIPQITYGRSQTTEYGNLRELVFDYVNAAGLFSAALAPFADRIGSQPLTTNMTFRNLLIRAGREDPVMAQVQDAFFDRRYYQPSVNWCAMNGFTNALSLMAIYDSFIHSGSILWVIRNKFPEMVPAAGGDEKAWITAYVKARHSWLANHSRPIVRKTVYRTRDLAKQIKLANWDLSMLPIDANGVNVGPKVP